MNKYIFAILSATMLIACVGTKGLKSVESKSISDILNFAHSNSADVDWFSAQMKGKAHLNNTVSHSISAQVRMRFDSLIWISVSAPLGIEALRISISPDSIKLINRINKTYFTEDIRSITNRYNLHLTYHDLQSILLGGHFFNIKGFKLISTNNDYVLSSISDTISYKLRINEEYLPLEIIAFNGDSNSFRLNYSNFLKVQDEWLPMNTELRFSSHTTSLDLMYSYSKILINRPRKIKFSIPSSYVPI